MKHSLLITGLAAATLAFVLTGCNSMKGLEKEVIRTAIVGEVTPQQLESVNGKIPFDYNVAFGPKQFHKKMTLKVTPKMMYGNNSVETLNPIYFQGEKVKGTDYSVVAWKGATTYSQKMMMNYKPGMEKGVLWAEIEAMHGNKSFTMEPVILNQNGVKVWQQYPISINGVNYVPVFTESFMEDMPEVAVGVVSGYIMFPLAESKITEAQMKSAIMMQAEKALKEVWSNPDAKIVNMLLYASSSPEGAERLNKDLTSNRFKAAKSFFEKQLGIANTSMAKDPKFVVPQMVNENWDGLYLLLDDSNISGKADMVKEMKNAKTNQAREALLETYIKKVPELKNVILPVLRRADFYIFYTMPAMEQDEQQVTYYIPQADMPTPSVPTQSNWQLLNDLAVIAIQNKDYRKAQNLLEDAIVLKQDAAVMNNMGVIYANQNNNSKAIDLLSKAQVKQQAQYNMGLILMKQGNYAKAIPYLKAWPDINLAYAQLMNNDNRAALDTFKSLKLTNATEYYMEAVAAARVKDTNTMAMALQKAIQLNAKMKGWAATDVEFYPYRGEPVFMQIVK